MATLTLVVGTQNYSSWSLRPWILMSHLELPFTTREEYGRHNVQEVLGVLAENGFVHRLDGGGDEEGTWQWTNESYPADAPAEMAKLARSRGFTFPYLYDESQQIAKAFRAACTPEFYLFDRNRRLAYRGQFDGSRPNSPTPVTGSDLRAAADAVLMGRAAAPEQVPSAGCGIKWKRGNAPDWD